MEQLEQLEEFRHPLRDIDMEKAEKAFEELAQTQEGQKEILERAKNGDPKAASYLYSRFKNLIARTYINYGEGKDITASQKGLKDMPGGFADTMATDAYLMLQGVQFGTHYGDTVEAGETGTSPFNKFNPDVFDENVDLIEKFGYYFSKYFQQHIFKALRAEENDYNMFSAGTRGGEVSLDAFGDEEEGSEDRNAALASEEDTAHSAEESILLDGIRDYIRQSGDKDADDMITVLDCGGWTDAEIKDEFGIKNPSYIRQKAAKLAKQYLGEAKKHAEEEKID